MSGDYSASTIMKNIDSITKCNDLCCNGVISSSYRLCVTSIQKCIVPASTPIVGDWNTSVSTMKWNIASSTSCTSHVTKCDSTMWYTISPNIM